MAGTSVPCATNEQVLSNVAGVAFNVDWKFLVKSWDRFQIPFPFSRCEVIVGRVMRVPAEATDAERESLRQQLEAELRAISRD